MMDAKDFTLVVGSRIQEITPDGIIYLSDEGEKQFIDFAVCNQNHVERSTRPEALEKVKEANHMTDEELQDHVAFFRDTHKQVGYRSFSGSPDFTHPYMQFFTEPPIRFEFQTESDFRKVQYMIRKMGWQTIDGN